MCIFEITNSFGKSLSIVSLAFLKISFIGSFVLIKSTSHYLFGGFNAVNPNGFSLEINVKISISSDLEIFFFVFPFFCYED